MNSLDDQAKPLTDPVSKAALFGLHTFVAMVIGTLLMIIAAGIAAPFFQDAPPRLKSWVEGGGLLNPFVWITGTVLGLLMNRFPNRRARSYAACWVWIVGMVWLSLAIWGSVRSYDARYAQGCSVLQDVVNAFFILNARRCEGGESTLAGLFFTIPAINSIGYAVGARLALRFSKKETIRE